MLKLIICQHESNPRGKRKDCYFFAESGDFITGEYATSPRRPFVSDFACRLRV